MSLERLTNNGNAKLYPEIFPLNKEQDAWFLKMHEQSILNNARNWFDNEFLEIVYDKFETGFVRGGTFCRDCEEKIFTLNADGSISGCPNSAPEFQFGSITDPIETLINSPIRLNTIACERSGNELCYSCDVFEYCGGDCHQLSWQDDICGAPKSLMQHLKYEKSTQTKVSKKIWVIKNGNIN
jgi:radical SAM protein with 4Fe4S-binding SPASM domain